MNNSKEVISLIKKLRTEKKMSLDTLSKKVGVAKSTLSRYESGQRDFPINDIGKYANALNVTIEHLLGLNKSESEPPMSEYPYYQASISAGIPLNVDAITNVETIPLPNRLMGKYAGDKSIFITRVNGDSMNRVIPDQSLIAVRKIELNNLKDGDIVIYSDGGYNYSCKRFYKIGDEIIFKPDSTDISFLDQRYKIDDNITIHGKVVMYIVQVD